MVKDKLERQKRITLKKIEIQRRNGFLNIEENMFDQKSPVQKGIQKFSNQVKSTKNINLTRLQILNKLYKKT